MSYRLRLDLNTHGGRTTTLHGEPCELLADVVETINEIEQVKVYEEALLLSVEADEPALGEGSWRQMNDAEWAGTLKNLQAAQS